MALSAKSLFLYGIEITAENESLDFRAVSLETPREATLRRGSYSLTELGEEIIRAMQVVDTGNNYYVLIDRDVSGGTQNRVTIGTDGAFLELLFSSGPRAASSVAPVIGFAAVDQTGGTSYQGTLSAGTSLIPDLIGYNYLSPDFDQRNFGAVNLSASGEKEAIVFQIQQFWQVHFKYISATKWVDEWRPLLAWLIQQRPIEFIPEISDPAVYFDGTMESTQADGRGVAFKGREMLPQFPNTYDAGIMRFRKRTISDTFI